jgi:alcohol dehydrogenase
MPLRRRVWERLATDLKPRHLRDMSATVTLEEMPAVFERMLKSQARGRTVVRIGG